MNQGKKIAAGIVCVVLLMMLLFPPFATTDEYGTKRHRGWSFIADPPKIYSKDAFGREYVDLVGTIDVSTLLIEYLFVVSIGGIIYYVLKDKKRG